MIDETADGRFALLLYPWLSVPLGVSSHVGRRSHFVGGETPRTARRGGHCGTGATGAESGATDAGGDSCGTGANGAESQRVDVSAELCRDAALHGGGVSELRGSVGGREVSASHAGLLADHRAEGEADDGEQAVCGAGRVHEERSLERVRRGHLELLRAVREEVWRRGGGAAVLDAAGEGRRGEWLRRS